MKILGTVLLREARLRDAAKAAELEGELGKTDVATVNKAKLQAALDALFPCP